MPVSDLVARMGYLGQDYRDLYEADYHIGEDAEDNVAEYKRRSPVWNVDKLHTPAADPHQHERRGRQRARGRAPDPGPQGRGQGLRVRDLQDVPGGHSFDRLDTPEAWAARKEIYAFLARYLKPPNPKIHLGLTAEGRAAP